MVEKIVGTDTGKDGWTIEIVGEIQPGGSLLITGEHRYRITIDVGLAEQAADAYCLTLSSAGQPPQHP